MQNHCAKIRNGEYSFIWVRIPGKIAIVKQKRERFNSVINSWMTVALSMNILAVHCARTWDKYEGKDHWMTYDDSFRQNKFESEHHLCHFDVKMTGKRGNVGPSGIVYRTLSTAEVPPHVCKYPGQEHAYDEARRDQEGTSTLRLQEETTFLKTLIDEWFQKGILVSYFSGVDATHRVSHSSQSVSLLRGTGLSTQDCQTRKPDSYGKL